MKETELWLFEVTGKHAKGSVNDGSGTTGLPNADAAGDEGKTLRRARDRGLADDDPDKKQSTRGGGVFADEIIRKVALHLYLHF